MMKTIILSICLIASVLFAEDASKYKQLTYDESVSLLKSIQSDAIVFGNGGKQVYVFIDPLCPHSRKFIRMISINPKMLSKYQYQLFLYSIPRLQSTEVVSAIYMSQTPLETLLEIMVEEGFDFSEGNEMTKDKVNRIAKVAQKMNVHKRPYIFIIK